MHSLPPRPVWPASIRAIAGDAGSSRRAGRAIVRPPVGSGARDGYGSPDPSLFYGWERKHTSYAGNAIKVEFTVFFIGLGDQGQ
jgi:hypothetical protein